MKIKPEDQIAMGIDESHTAVLTESRTMRDNLVFKDEVLEKVKIIPKLPVTAEVTIEMAANYYDVDFETVKQVIKRNREEFNEYGEIRVLKGASLIEFKAKMEGRVHDVPNLSTSPSLTLISRRGLLRLGMMLTKSEIAKSVRHYLLNIEEISTDEQRHWAIEREISKRERRRLTDAIQSFYQGTLKKGFEYSTFTNLVYKILWDTNANGMRKMYDLDKNDSIRESLSTDDLRRLVDVESTISALIRINKEYAEIKEELLVNAENFR